MPGLGEQTLGSLFMRATLNSTTVQYPSDGQGSVTTTANSSILSGEQVALIDLITYELNSTGTYGDLVIVTRSGATIHQYAASPATAITVPQYFPLGGANGEQYNPFQRATPETDALFGMKLSSFTSGSITVTVSFRIVHIRA